MMSNVTSMKCACEKCLCVLSLEDCLAERISSRSRKMANTIAVKPVQTVIPIKRVESAKISWLSKTRKKSLLSPFRSSCTGSLSICGRKL